MKVVIRKLAQSACSILPIVVIVYLLALTPIFAMTVQEKIVYILASCALIVGMTLFEIGAEMSMSPMGDYAGTGLIKTKKLKLILAVAFVMGFLVTIAEPDLAVLAEQVAAAVNPTIFVASVGIGVGIFLLMSLLKVIFNQPLSRLLLLFYMLIFALTALLSEMGRNNMMPLAYDSGGVTTGPLTVPFIMAFGIGIAATIGGRNSNENSFGFVSLCSIGPILVVLLYFVMSSGEISYVLPDYTMASVLKSGVIKTFFSYSREVVRALVAISIFFLILDFFIIKLPISTLIQIVAGLLLTFVGLAMFLTSAAIGFLPIGYSLGSQLVLGDYRVVILLCFVIGMTVVLAEPAIHVLTVQVEEVTGGTVSKRSMLIALSVGVGFAIALSMIRIIKGFSILYYLIPGYFIALALSFFVPPIYTAIAFDSGGVASGPLTSTFILPFMIGACVEMSGASAVLRFAFGVVALVAMTPLISIQVLGFRAIFAKKLRDRISLNRILQADDDQIIYFEV